MTTRIGPEASGGVVTVARGDEVELALPENAGTGYEWLLEPLPEGMELLDDRTDPAATGMAGASGRRVFRLRIGGSGELTARLRRRWEPPEVANQTYTVRVVAG